MKMSTSDGMIEMMKRNNDLTVEEVFPEIEVQNTKVVPVRVSGAIAPLDSPVYYSRRPCEVGLKVKVVGLSLDSNHFILKPEDEQLKN